MSRDDSYSKLERVRALLVTRVTTGRPAGEEGDEYQRLRRELLAVPTLKDKLPGLLTSCFRLDDAWGLITPKFSTYRERREHLRAEFAPVLRYLETDPGNSPGDRAISATLRRSGVATVGAAWEKALARRATDPEGAITAARTLLESACKFILEEGGAVYDDKADLPKLYRLAADQLTLSPSQHGEAIFKQILGGCQTVVEGLGALRNRYGDAHGKGTAAPRPAARHAELAVNLAGAMATFLVATRERRMGTTLGER